MNASGPLVARWLTLEHIPVEAGALHRVAVEVANAGSAPWRTRGPEEGLFLSYHWLDERGNAIVWDGYRTPLEQTVAPGETLRQELVLRGPIPPGPYRLAVDLVEEHRFWLSELGVAPLEVDVDVAKRDASAARAFLPEGAELSADWHERVRALHEEGFSAVGGALDVRRGPRELEPYAAGGGRHPRFPHPLVCPSLLPPLEPNVEVAGLPAYQANPDEPAMFDGRLLVRLRSRSGRRRS
ncbi:MAG: hypothetical protein QOF43_579 [Gaiellaceae bacterium]|nr:hypothetical protein [Gaiellaceae bacterium]